MIMAIMIKIIVLILILIIMLILTFVIFILSWSLYFYNAVVVYEKCSGKKR